MAEQDFCAVFFVFLLNVSTLSTWIYSIYNASTIMPPSDEFNIMLSIAAFLMLISQWAYCKAKCSNPGKSHESILSEDVSINSEHIKLRSRVLQKDEITLKRLLNSNQLDMNELNQLSHRPELPVTKAKLEIQLEELRAYKSTHITFCWECDQFKPVRTHHCSSCQACINRMDHHCQFLGVCIGRHNHRYFMQYLFWTLVTLVFMICHLLWMENYVKENDTDQVRETLVYVIIFIAGFFSLYIFCLWQSQCRRGCRNVTMLEDWTGKVGSTFDRGSCFGNLDEVCNGANCCSF